MKCKAYNILNANSLTSPLPGFWRESPEKGISHARAPRLAKMAYERLRDSILNGQLEPGQIYNEMALAKELGISRTPVREALLEFSAQGLITFLPRKGVVIKHYTRKDVIEIFELRRVVELTAIEKVAKADPPLDLSRIEKYLEDQRKSADM